MSQFDAALAYLHGSLDGLRLSKRDGLRASTASLARLKAAAAQQNATPRATPSAGPGLVPPPTEHVAEAPAPDACEPAPPKSATISLESKKERIAELRGSVLACTRCGHLAQSRTQAVFGVGNIDAELMFVGEAPGEDEDLQGEPFVGRAGQLLTKIIEAMGFTRQEVYIGNVLKCRPDMPAHSSGNRKPRADEMAVCLPYLKEQIAIIQPRILVALGATAMEGLTGTTEPMARLRGRWHTFEGIPLMATYHPAYLLRNQSIREKRKVWEDMLMVLEKLGRPISQKQRGYFLQK